jgi:hypothetical protein
VTLILIGRLRLPAAGDERRQSGIAALGTGLLRHLGLRTAAIGLLTRQIGLGLIGLGLARRIGRLLLARIGHVARHRLVAGLVVARVEVVAALVRIGTEIGIALTELFLRRRDQAEIMLRVLEVVLRRHRVARSLGVAGKLHVLLGDVIWGPADLHVGTVGFVDPRERILALAVAPPHAFVLTVSHGCWFICSRYAAAVRRFSPHARPVRPGLRSRRCCASHGAAKQTERRPRVDATISLRWSYRSLARGHPAVLPIPRPARCLNDTRHAGEAFVSRAGEG